MAVQPCVDVAGRWTLCNLGVYQNYKHCYSRLGLPVATEAGRQSARSNPVGVSATADVYIRIRGAMHHVDNEHNSQDRAMVMPSSQGLLPCKHRA